jgi:hypothetical protein
LTWYIVVGIVVGIKTFFQLVVLFDEERLSNWALATLTLLSVILWPVAVATSATFGII